MEKKIQDITDKFHKIYNDDMKNIGVKKPDVQPKATDHIKEMIEMIKSLVRKEFAYVVDKHVLLMLKNINIMESYHEELKKNKLQEVELRLLVIKKKSWRILFYGNQVKMMNLVGTHHGETVGQVGI